MTKKNTKKQAVHIVLQGKGGIGKSFIANMLMQYIADSGDSVIGLDTDPSNPTLSSYVGLGAARVDIMDGNRIDIKRFDEVMKLIHEKDEDVVLDIGSSCFVPFTQYVTDQDIFTVMEEMLGVKVYLHVIVVGGESKDQTLKGLIDIIESGVPNESIVIWENEHFGRIGDKKRVIETHMIQKVINKVQGSGVLRLNNNDLLGDDLRIMQKNLLTFDEVKGSDTFDFMEKMRLDTFRKAIWALLDGIFSIKAQAEVETYG